MFSETIFLKRTQVSAFNPHCIILGKSGSGKSNAAESILTNFLEKNQYSKEKFKCIDLYDSGRFENFCYSLKENRPDLCHTLHDCYSEPASFPTEILMINGSHVVNYKTLPKNVKVVSFDQSTLRVQDLFFLLGSTSRLYGVLTYISNMFGEDLTLRELYELFTKQRLRGKGVSLEIQTQTRQMMIRNLRKWLTSGMFSDNCEKIDFTKIVNDTSTITSFCTVCLESDEESIAYGIILKNLFDLKRKQKVEPTIKCYIREISNFLTTSSIDLGEKNFAQHYILRMLREGRDYKCEVMGDTQRGQDLPTKYRRQFGYTIQMKSDYADAEKLKDIQFIQDKFIHQVNRFALGVGMILTGQDLTIPVKFRPCRHRHKKSNMRVLEVLGKKYGEYKVDHQKLLKVDEKIATNHTLDAQYKPPTESMEAEKKRRKMVF